MSNVSSKIEGQIALLKIPVYVEHGVLQILLCLGEKTVQNQNFVVYVSYYNLSYEMKVSCGLTFYPSDGAGVLSFNV